MTDNPRSPQPVALGAPSRGPKFLLPGLTHSRVLGSVGREYRLFKVEVLSSQWVGKLELVPGFFVLVGFRVRAWVWRLGFITLNPTPLNEPGEA